MCRPTRHTGKGPLETALERTRRALVLQHDRGGGYEIYIDDRRTWMINLILTPDSSICRVERYRPPPHPTVDGVPKQLRAYTPQFVAQVASGARTMRRNLNFGDLIAGPGGR